MDRSAKGISERVFYGGVRMNRLTYKNPNGKWGLKNGYDIQKVPHELYGALCKLKDYEETGLNPDGVERINDFFDTQTAEILAELQAYKKTELTPEKMVAISKEFRVKCEEVNKLTKEIEHLKVKIENLEQAQ